MKSVLATLVFAAFQTISSAGDLPEEIGSYEEAFHHALHKAPEIYLVCYYQVDKKTWAKDWEKLEIKATIVEVIRGKRKIGERIEFERVLDGKYGDISKMAGALQYIQYYRNKHEGSPEFGKLYIDPQDPIAIFPYSTAFSAMVSEHKAKAQQDAPPPTAGATHSK